jgi:hypothetical protein
MKASERCRRSIVWRESNPRYLRAEIRRHLAHGRTATEIALRMGIRVATVEGIISPSKGKTVDGGERKR